MMPSGFDKQEEEEHKTHALIHILKNGTWNSRNPKRGAAVLVPGTTVEQEKEQEKPLPWRVLTEWQMPSAQQHEFLDFW